MQQHSWILLCWGEPKHVIKAYPAVPYLGLCTQRKGASLYSWSMQAKRAKISCLGHQGWFLLICHSATTTFWSNLPRKPRHSLVSYSSTTAAAIFRGKQVHEQKCGRTQFWNVHQGYVTVGGKRYFCITLSYEGIRLSWASKPSLHHSGDKAHICLIKAMLLLLLHPGSASVSLIGL